MRSRKETKGDSNDRIARTTVRAEDVSGNEMKCPDANSGRGSSRGGGMSKEITTTCAGIQQMHPTSSNMSNHHSLIVRTISVDCHEDAV